MSPNYLEQIGIHTIKKREGGLTHLPPPPEPSPDATKSSLISKKILGEAPFSAGTLLRRQNSTANDVRF